MCGCSRPSARSQNLLRVPQLDRRLVAPPHAVERDPEIVDRDPVVRVVHAQRVLLNRRDAAVLRERQLGLLAVFVQASEAVERARQRGMPRTEVLLEDRDRAEVVIE